MGTRLEEYRKQNIDKIKIGSCLDFIFMLDSFESDFDRLRELVDINKEFLTNQSESLVLSQIQSVEDVLTNSIDMLLNDIDKKEIYCQYHSRYY